MPRRPVDPALKIPPQHVRDSRPLLTGRFISTSDYRVERPGGSDDWLLFATEAGQGQIQGETALPGQLHLLAPRQAHRYQTDEKIGSWTFTWIHFLPQAQWAHLLAWPTIAPALHGVVIADAVAFAALCGHLHGAHQHALSTRHHGDALALNALEAALLMADEFNPDGPAARDGRLDPRLREVLARVAGDLAFAWDIEAMAAIAGWSPSRFAHRFSDSLGETPRTLVERLRLDRARQLLQATTLSVQAIAAAVGFEDPFHFSNRMRAVSGKAPSGWRTPPGMGPNKP